MTSNQFQMSANIIMYSDFVYNYLWNDIMYYNVHSDADYTYFFDADKHQSKIKLNKNLESFMSFKDWWVYNENLFEIIVQASPPNNEHMIILQISDSPSWNDDRMFNNRSY